MPEEVNIDELLDLKTDEERRQRLQVPVCLSSRLSVLLVCLHPSVLLVCLHLSVPVFQVIFHPSNSSTEVRPRHTQHRCTHPQLKIVPPPLKTWSVCGTDRQEVRLSPLADVWLWSLWNQ